MTLADKVNYILGLSKNPSEKIGLISLVLSEKPITTAELNTLNNWHKTFENYKLLFEESLENGLVKIEILKDYRGTKRQHFCIDSAILENYIESM